MAENLFIAPMKVLNITQSYDGKTSHLPHMSGKKTNDYCLDIAGKDTGRDDFFCPVDELKIMHIYGVGKSGTNTVFFESTKKVTLIDGSKDYITLQLTHMNDDDLKKLKVGQVFKRGEKMFREGSDGATANHIHMSIRRGKYVAPGWTKNENGAWCCISTGAPLKPEDVMYLEHSTVIKKTQGLEFPVLTEKAVKYMTTARLNVRNIPTTKGSKVLAILEDGAKVSVTATAVCGKWGRTAKGWICLDYAKKC